MEKTKEILILILIIWVATLHWFIATAPKGDLNRDGKVDVVDMSILLYELDAQNE